jgi:hypothetical protein
MYCFLILDSSASEAIQDQQHKEAKANVGKEKRTCYRSGKFVVFGANHPQPVKVIFIVRFLEFWGLARERHCPTKTNG